MDNRDIFDEEFDRLNLGQQEPQNQFDSWSTGYNVYQKPEPKQPHKPLKIVLTAILMVVCIALGWVLAVITTDKPIDDERQEILDEVFNYMDYNFYQEVTEEEWQLAVEQAGTALMQYAGDQYSFLMSPQTYYDFMNNVGSILTAASNLNELFGMTYQMESKGMLITDVMPDSVSYGRLQPGDLIVKMTNIKEYIPIVDNDGMLQLDEDGNLLVERYTSGLPRLANSPYTNGILLEGATTTQVGNYLLIVYSATFHVLRNGQIVTFNLARNKVGISYDENNIDQNKRYDFKFVEYYINDTTNNISTTPQNGAAISTYEARGLSKLPAKTAYIHLIQFDKLTENGVNKAASCDEEVKAVLEMFKKSNCEYLVFDLKGNPGGYVYLATNIAGMLLHPNNLSDANRNKVEIGLTSSTSKYLVAKLLYRDGEENKYTAKSSYYNYFPQAELSGGKKRIIVWTDEGSASASELLLGALLDYGTAVHMGTKTYGKGIAQTVEELNIKGKYVDINGITHDDGAWAVYYTCANYYSPLGANIHGIGFTPASKYQASTYSDLWTLAKSYWGI